MSQTIDTDRKRRRNREKEDSEQAKQCEIRHLPPTTTKLYFLFVEFNSCAFHFIQKLPLNFTNIPILPLKELPNSMLPLLLCAFIILSDSFTEYR